MDGLAISGKYECTIATKFLVVELREKDAGFSLPVVKIGMLIVKPAFR